MGGNENRPESGARDLRARQMGTKADPWRDGNGPAEEGPERTEAEWQEPIGQGAAPYPPGANQAGHEPMPASHHADRRDETAGGDGEADTDG